MGAKSNQRMRSQVRERLAELLGASDANAEIEVTPHAVADLVVKVDGLTLVVECASNPAATRVADAARHARESAAKVSKKAIPVVAVPFMGPAGRDQCERLQVGWLDLSGNAHIIAHGLRIHIDGQCNRFASRGRPRSVFAPRSSRIARQLLLEPARAFGQSELAKTAGIDAGLASRVLHRLEQDGLVKRVGGKIQASNPALLLDAWREQYDFQKHTIIKGHIAARSGEDLVRQLAKSLTAEKIPYAVTGLAGAWLLSHFAEFRITTVFLGQTPSTQVLDSLGFRQDDAGANVWLVMPTDDSVFRVPQDREGVVCAHPLQVYLDLKGHPERAREAADRVRQDFLRFEDK